MNKLISASSLISESWQFTVKEWKPFVKLTKWTIFIPLIFTIPIMTFAGLTEFLPSTAAIWGLLYGITLILYYAFMIWIYLRVIDALLKRDLQQPLNFQNQDRAKQLIFPVILVALLMVFPIFLGYVIFILPGVWLGTALAFSMFFLLEDNKRGRMALVASYRLVKGRWWATFWRRLAVGLFAIVLFLIIYFILFLVFALIALLVGGLIAAKLTLLAILLAVLFGLAFLVGFMVFSYLFLVPFFLVIEIKLFHSLKATQVQNPTA